MVRVARVQPGRPAYGMGLEAGAERLHRPAFDQWSLATLSDLDERGMAGILGYPIPTIYVSWHATNRKVREAAVNAPRVPGLAALRHRAQLDLAHGPAGTINADGLSPDERSSIAVREAFPNPVYPSYDLIDALEPEGASSDSRSHMSAE